MSALLTADELKASREAIKAQVDGLSDAEVSDAISDAEDLCYQAIGYAVSTEMTEITVPGDGGPTLYLPEHVQSVTEVDAGGTAASGYQIAGAGFQLHRISGIWGLDVDFTITGTFGYPQGSRVWRIAKKAVRRLAVRDLTQTKVGGISVPHGALLTGYASENAQFSYFTPQGGLTGDADVDRWLDLIKHPFKASTLHSVSMVARPIARPRQSELS